MIMKSGACELDGLPIEILRHIAAVGTCQAALALSKVNKTLHTACYDRLVFKAIIDNRNGNERPRWQHHLPLSMETPVSSWTRYALADSKAAQGHALGPDPHELVSWAPQLMAYHHPFLHLASTLILDEALQLVGTKATGWAYALAFCLALRLMSEESAGDLGPQWPTQASTPWARTRRNLMQILNPPIYFGIDFSHFSACDFSTIVQKHVHALKAVGLFSVILRETIELGRIWPPPSGSSRILAVAVPTSTSIPFHLMMDVPLPFSPNAGMELASCHLARMTTADFLEDGEWAGFYTIPNGPYSVIFDPPMHGIRFVVTANNDSPTTLNLHGTGEDSISTFDLDGKISPTTGQIILKKVYFGGSPAWDWNCIMTPMGIVGVWGKRINHGWIWLWKVGWTTGH